jgi:cellobiose phosphorylase
MQLLGEDNMILSKEQLREEAHKSALNHDPFISRKPSNDFYRINESDIQTLRAFVNDLRQNNSACSQPAEEWLLDNAEFLEEQSLTIKFDLTKKLVKSLPHLNKSGEYRIFDICTDYLKHCDGNFNLDTFKNYIKAYQEVAVLGIAEVWAIPVIMRIALFRKLTNVMENIKDRRNICSRVEEIISKLDSQEITPELLKDALEKSGYEMPLSGPMIVHLVKHLRERADYSATVGEWLICKLENGPESLDHILSYEYQLQAGYQHTTGNIISSLRSLSRLDWLDTFEEISIVEQTLLNDCTGVYSQLDSSSREVLRKRVEHLAKRLNLPENLVSQHAVDLTNDFYNNNSAGDVNSITRPASVSYYLLEPKGIEQLRQSLKTCGKPRSLPETSLLQRSEKTYASALSLCFVLFLVGFSLFIGGNRVFVAEQWILLLLLLAIPSLEWAISAAHWMIERVKKPIPLLRFNFSKGVPKDAATMVVIPVIWSSREEVEEITDRLELHYLANRDENIHFAILGDYADSENETIDTDDVVFKAAREEIARLNESYPNSKFHLFQRKRVWNPSEGKWMGWERKRGKLVEFVELIKGKQSTNFIINDGDTSFLKKIKYIITLDADTQLPLESAHRMIGTMHLPFNRPILNAKKTRVVEGYGVLQPRVGMSHDAAMKSRLSSLWSQDPGVDPYAFAVSDPYQDGLGQGIFTGKGIFDVDSFYQILCERIPDNRVLSHDLLEGGFLRAGLLSDIELVDDHPEKFSTYQKRQHRWIRGDWQLLLWLLPKNYNRRGELVPVDLSVLTKWQIIDNMRRSLMSPILFALLLAGITVLPGSSLRWISVILLTLFLPTIKGLFSFSNLYKDPKGILFTIGQGLVTLVTLPFQIAMSIDAIGRSLYRLAISKKRLLEWVTAADADRKIKQNREPIIQGMVFGYILIIAFFAAVLFSGDLGVWLIGFTLSAIWAVTPAIVNWLDSAPASSYEQYDFTEEETNDLKKLAREIWSFYEDYVTANDSWLPPDNVQMDPPNGIAHRTSPTNIGLYLTCVLAARDFEFIDTQEMIERIEKTVSTIERMEKWEGHLYNWYDTETLRPLHPTYVSTVDSGNMVGCFMIVKEGLVEWLKTSITNDEHNNNKDLKNLNVAFAEELAPQLQRDETSRAILERGKKLIKRLDILSEETNFRPLYDHNAKLFSLGYHAERNKRDEVLYDLMASEARIASFVAIASNQVSVSHWRALGRTMTKTGNQPVLLSWSGTMFEYLMPWLFMKTYKNSIWDSTYRAVVNRQMEYASQRGVPFGISESGYYAYDFQMNYQYRAFGVPGLGFKRGLEEDLVVAPYATVMALPFAKRKSLEALKNMENLDARGKYGFYEAIDFTKERLPEKTKQMVIKSFMAHHQGMSLLAIGNVLLSKKMYDRFHKNKQVRAAELLLQERIPKRPKFIKHPSMDRLHEPLSNIVQDVTTLREFTSTTTRIPEVCILSNGEFTTVMTNSGSGFSKYKGLSVSRWREDPVMDPWGSFVYIKDITKDKVWSPSYQPCKVESTEQRVQFGLDKATYMRVDNEVSTSMEVCVPSEWNCELRRITLTNLSKEKRVLEVSTFVELALANPIADDAHTAFSKLFIRTAFDAESGCLVAGRRPREEKDFTLWSAHSLIVEGKAIGTIEYETDRSSFIGRGYRLTEPHGLHSRLKGKVGSVADPAFVMRRRVSLDPGETAQLIAITSVSDTREEALDIISRFKPEHSVERAFQLAWNRGQIELRNLHLSNREATSFQTLASQILYNSPLRSSREKSILRNLKSQPGLWSFGVSGDRPIILLQIYNQSQMPFAVKILTAHEYLRRLGIQFDLVILNESEEGYHQHLQEALQRAAEQGVDRFGAGLSGVYVLAAGQLMEVDKMLLNSVARISLNAGGASLLTQLKLPSDITNTEFPEILTVDENPKKYKSSYEIDYAKELKYFNGWGGFTPDGNEYKIIIKNGNNLPAPWINVLANSKFGCLISELGTGYTWWKNSREFKITPWSNDPVLDQPTETAYLRDEESGEVWSVAPSAVKSEEPYVITHGQGYTIIDHERNGIKHEMLMYVPLNDPIKIVKIKLKNNTTDTRRISVTYYAEWVLGVQRQSNAPYIVTEWHNEVGIMTARNMYQETFRDATAFLGMILENASTKDYELSYTADRYEFIGRNKSMEQPEALERVNLSGRTGTNYESCGAIQNKLTLQPNEEKVVYVLLGCEQSRENIYSIADKYKQPQACDHALKEVKDFWDNEMNQISVETPSQEMNILLNNWLLYQTLACRMWARTAFYQAGGAYGFRDQLQDSLALLHTLPHLTRNQIVLHASHQYEEGDVQHWWHRETDRGIRTLFSDDLLWLPYAVSRYIEHTGDKSVLEEVVPYLFSEELRDGEHERYEETVRSSKTGTVYEHCLKAIDKALSRIGEHGLPLIGVGDWNDGMNLAGVNGRGESVWLGWFIVDVLNRFNGICALNDDSIQNEKYQKAREDLIRALNEHGWDGQWYRRAFTDSGSWLGSMTNEECQIDAIAQSWSVISGGAPKERAVQAMQSFDRELVDRELSVVRLLTPPFDNTYPSPGYIQGYPPGLRENGAQYTHGVLWSIVAWCQLNQGDKAVEMFNMLNPINHTRTDHEVRTYFGEPYVMAADVYTASPSEGHAGWTWYTGASGWMYQAGVEWILGIRRREDKLYIDPKIPNDWPGFKVTYRFGKSKYLIDVKNKVNCSDEVSVSLKIDGFKQLIKDEGIYINLTDDGKDHRVEVEL